MDVTFLRNYTESLITQLEYDIRDLREVLDDRLTSQANPEITADSIERLMESVGLLNEHVQEGTRKITTRALLTTYFAGRQSVE